MSVQSWLDSEARRLLAEELQADATEATAPSYDSRFKGVSDDAPLSLDAEPLPILHVDLLMDGDELQALPLTDGLDPLSLLCGTQAFLTAPRLSDDPDGSDGASPYPIQASPRSETSCLFGPWPNYAASISSRETGRSLLVGSNPASRRRSPNDPKGDR